MKAQELREKFIDFMTERGHKYIPSYPLVPQDDPSVLFTTAGMHPLVPYLMGEKHPLGKRLVDIQKCIRTDDIDEVGDIQHLTFFEMLGYWSLGDYFKKESIHFTFDFYTKVLGFSKNDISVTVFKGGKDAPSDRESFNTWKDEIGIPEERIYEYDKKENWWGPVSDTGPCGPCTEMFIDTGINDCGPNCGPACNCDKFVEIGNNVFMEYFKNAEGKFEKLEQKNVDVGLGLERLVMFTQNKKTVFETDLFESAVAKIQELANTKSSDSENSVRIVADHLRSATFALAEKILPSNIDRGYVVRRLIRRAIRHGKLLGIDDIFTSEVSKVIIRKMGSVYPELKDNEKFIYEELKKEEEKFNKTLEEGLKKIQRRIIGGFGAAPFGGQVSKEANTISGKDAFDLFQTYGFPIEMTEELAKEKDLKVDRKGFEQEYRKHQELSRKGAEQKFKGGLGDQSEMAVKYHTATHLLHEALRKILGPHVYQRGSNITAERLRFDFSHPDKMTHIQLKAVEEMVNDKIKSNLKIYETITTVDDAKGNGAIGIFDAKYGEKVKVYSIGGDLKSSDAFSKEICGGPHVKNTSGLGKFKIIKEEASSAGVRRIKAILE
ncbi:alanine--tRNA ligase [bacterium CG_4_10_14_0_2_um_filter_33_32]|nr:MAG: alanine--tRNA ligase [bacterium CG2_30_33_46]PIR68049.1 MAG: alanine--tRNA ligase [bacterium CG10_big_fil_rev_8_21_14_0_10_33_18]PIU76722.1 MAG: alanine--tRNA ligase [bacterium CG06_land_8_20_14_3_00_33_50]PIW80816.1 MAG: alanine--tRNA ligase [bacterium CG_4_8_14_3_um_filter_33_28]PIY85151.1 MAG: alanine--tRNA ligase [bacterium CG_4_10_14_0_8_um_filter_33_57]PIZ85356.1 MAG: alanine--tRNA ligase [bacterium CG_4_10_14_0_2_um_filter_33_32]PJA72184.1 MAG: alanine--tRNA ligase [bacterium C